MSDVSDSWQSGVDKSILELTNHAGTTTAQLNALNSNMAGMSEKLDKFIATQQSNSKTPWANYIAGATMLLLIMAMASNGYLRDLERTEKAGVTLQQDYVAHIKDGHPYRVEQRVDQNKETIALLDEVLQREMRLLDAKGQADLTGLDTRLQIEMRLINDSMKIRVEELGRRTTVSESWEDAHDKRVVGLNSRQTARINELEKRLEKIEM